MTRSDFYTRMTAYYGPYDAETDGELVRSVQDELGRITDDAYEDLYVALIRYRPRKFGPPDVESIDKAAATLRDAGMLIDRPRQHKPCPICGTAPGADSMRSCKTCGFDLTNRRDAAAVREHAAWWADLLAGRVARISLSTELAKMMARGFQANATVGS